MAQPEPALPPELQGQLQGLRQGDQQGRGDDGVPRHGAQPQGRSRTRTTRASCRSCSPSASRTPHGNANYEQEDIVQIARAFTGWDYDDKGVAVLRRRPRTTTTSDCPERGPKVIFKNARRLRRSGRPGLRRRRRGRARDRHGHRHHLRAPRHATGKNTVARYIARRLLDVLRPRRSATSAFVDEVVADVRASTPTFDIADAAARDLRPRRLLRDVPRRAVGAARRSR